MADRIRWGVIGTAKIARTTLIPAIKQSGNGKVLAVASRDKHRARAFADELDIERAYGAYEDLLADPDIDAIYIPLPNDSHMPWGIAAAKAHKPTLIEKPIARTAAEAQQVVDAFRAENVLLAEAFMYRYHPQHDRVRALLADGSLGPLKMMTAAFTYAMASSVTDNVRLKPELGGGALLDVGCYCVNACRMMIGTEPDQVTAQAIYGSASKVDESFAGTMRFPGDILVHFDCGMRTTFRNTYTLICEKGTITVVNAFRPPDGDVTTLQVQRAGADIETITIPACHHYVLMVEDFAHAVQHGKKLTYDPADSIKNMRVLDALDKSAREGIVVKL